MADETELKLDLSPDGADRVAASGLLVGDPPAIELLSTYFDTADRAVARAGYSLRIRDVGGRRVQTIKAGGARGAGLFVRAEWERPVAGEVPILDAATPLPRLLGPAADALAPAFEARIRRRTWRIDDAAGSIELAVDRGEMVSGTHRAPVCEIELELKSGDRAALFALARMIDAIAPVRLGLLSKSERGYRLIAAKRTNGAAETPALAAAMSAAQAFRLIVMDCIRQFRWHETQLLERRDPDALHQARVALRRLRSAFSIFGPMIGDDGARLRDELRWLASTLGEARDLDALRERVQPGAIRDRILLAREASCDRGLEALESARARLLMLDLVQWIAAGDWGHRGEQPARRFAAQALGRLRRKVKRGGRPLTRLDDDARHGVRKTTKKLRYATEFFAALFERKRERRRRKRFLSAIEALQDRLGTLNDLAAAPDVLARAGLGEQALAALAIDKAAKAELLGLARTAYARLVDSRTFW